MADAAETVEPRVGLTEGDLASLPQEYREWFAAVHINDVQELIRLYRSSLICTAADYTKTYVGIKYLININFISQQFGTLLAHAVRVGADDCVKQLLDWGANVDISYGEAIDEAVMPNRRRFIKILCEHGAVIRPDVMRRAARIGDNELLIMLHKYGGDINSHDHGHIRPLMVAIVYDNVETVKLLLDMGVDINFTNLSGETALDFARRYNNNELYNILRTYAGMKTKSANKK